MNGHVDRETLQSYVEDQLNDADQHAVEKHLSDCATCFEHYLDIIDDWSVPHSVSRAFTDNTMEILQKVQPAISEKSSSTSNDVRKKTVTHYFLAAGLTMILMFTGVFQMIFDMSEQIDLEGEPLSWQILEVDLFQAINQGEEEQE